MICAASSFITSATRERSERGSRQVRDSVNVPHTGPVSWILLPLGIGYHALHHLDPLLPYHAMGSAHQLLMRELPEGSIYRRSTQRSIWSAAKQAARRENLLLIPAPTEGGATSEIRRESFAREPNSGADSAEPFEGRSSKKLHNLTAS